MRDPLTIGDERVQPGERRLVVLPVSKLSNHTPVTLPVHVLHGTKPGPRLFVSAAIHGDEINGVEIIRRVLRMLQPSNLAGTLLCVPVVNAYGFIGRSRYLPDRRDLNRSFPGSPTGSLAARLAHIFLTEVVSRCEVGIDLHTAAVHRVNLPQIRAEFTGSTRRRDLATAFGCQIALESPERAGSLRQAARAIGVDVLVYEGGEGLRFDEFAIEAGVRGIAGVMEHIGMLRVASETASARPTAGRERPLFADTSKWVRAPDGGVFRTSRRIGDAVSLGETIGFIANPSEEAEIRVESPRRGIIVGRTTLPVVNMGDALFHIAWAAEHAPPRTPARRATAENDATDPIMDEDEII